MSATDERPDDYGHLLRGHEHLLMAVEAFQHAAEQQAARQCRVAEPEDGAYQVAVLLPVRVLLDALEQRFQELDPYGGEV